MIRLRVFGPIELHDATGRELTTVLSQPKRLSLLVYLAAARSPGFHRRDTLLALFWPDLDGHRARAALNQAIGFLRKELGAGVIISRGAGEVATDGTALWCDAAAFRDHIQSGSRHGEALELYRGDLLEGFFAAEAPGFEQWLERERAQIRAEAARAARALAEIREKEDNFTTAVASARRAVELSDADERVVRELLQMLDRLGDRAGAIHAYEQFARRLADEYGAEPAVETMAVIDRIRTRAALTPQTRPSGKVTAVGAVGQSTSFSPVAGNLGENGWQVVRELGRGGMAIVYLAKDAKHGRHVALKVMRRDVALPLGTERFLREIQITAQLAHPHILPLIDSGVGDDTLFLVTPYVAGESLRARLIREKRLPVADAIRIATETAEALDYAHRSGIVHRDIKPENILLADGHAVVADFGVARALSASGAVSLIPDSDLSAVVGSRAYMSPEQISVNGNAGPSADLYSLGCVLFEMLNGTRPHGGETPEDVLHGRSDAPIHVARLISDCLSREPGRRPESARHVIGRLEAPAPNAPPAVSALVGSRRRWVGAAIAVAAVAALLWMWPRGTETAELERNVIAVLPFRVTAPDSSYNYLREGAVDLLSAGLTGDGIPRSIDTRAVLSAYRVRTKAQGGDLPSAQAASLARRLGAMYALTGEVVATSGQITVSTRLLSASSGRAVADHIETGTGSALGLVSRAGMRLLAKSLGEAATRVRYLSDSLDAVRAYLAGMQSYRSGQTRAAFDQLGQALQIDSTFAPAALWRAYVAWGASTFGSPEKRGADSVAWSLRAHMSRRDSLLLASLPSIGPNYPRPFTAIELLNALERAAQANADRPEAWYSLASHLSAWGLQANVADPFQRAAIAADSAIALDSAFLPALRHRLYMALLLRDTATTRSYAERWLSLGGNQPSLRFAVARVLRDTADLPALLAQIVARPLNAALQNLELWASYYGLVTIDDAEREAVLRRAQPGLAPDQRGLATKLLWRAAALRGRRAHALALADSFEATGVRPNFIQLALAEPGYETLAESAIRFFGAFNDTTTNHAQVATNVCYTQLWRVNRGDTSTARRDVALMRKLVSARGVTPGWMVTKLDVCPQLIEAALDQKSAGSSRAASLARVENLLLQGILSESPGNAAYLLVARWLEARGEHARALSVIRRRDPMSAHLVEPAAWRLEGKLAALVGDTAAAFHAYTRYLEIRDQPDPGPLSDERRAVQRYRAELTARWR